MTCVNPPTKAVVSKGGSVIYYLSTESLKCQTLGQILSGLNVVDVLCEEGGGGALSFAWG